MMSELLTRWRRKSAPDVLDSREDDNSFLLRNDLELLVTCGDITKTSAAAIVVEEDEDFSGRGRTAVALRRSGGDLYEHARNHVKELARGDGDDGRVYSTTAGDNLVFRFVFHAIAKRHGNQRESDTQYLEELFYNIGSLAETNGADTVVMPLLGSDKSTASTLKPIQAALQGLSRLCPQTLQAVTIVERRKKKAAFIAENILSALVRMPPPCLEAEEEDATPPSRKRSSQFYASPPSPDDVPRFRREDVVDEVQPCYDLPQFLLRDAAYHFPTGGNFEVASQSDEATAADLLGVQGAYPDASFADVEHPSRTSSRDFGNSSDGAEAGDTLASSVNDAAMEPNEPFKNMNTVSQLTSCNDPHPEDDTMEDIQEMNLIDLTEPASVLPIPESSRNHGYTPSRMETDEKTYVPSSNCTSASVYSYHDLPMPSSQGTKYACREPSPRRQREMPRVSTIAKRHNSQEDVSQLQRDSSGRTDKEVTWSNVRVAPLHEASTAADREGRGTRGEVYEQRASSLNSSPHGMTKECSGPSMPSAKTSTTSPPEADSERLEEVWDCGKTLPDSFEEPEESETERGGPSVQRQVDIRIGTMPEGKMSDSTTDKVHLPGHESYSIIIVDYIIPNGIQGPRHPRPGRAYTGTRQCAYLPDSPEGRHVLELLRQAYDRKLTFQVCEDPEGQGVVDWSDIPHKTSIRGGKDRGGYPDPTYLQEVEAVLRDNYGIQ